MSRPIKRRDERLVAITSWVLPATYDALCVVAKAQEVSLSRWCAMQLAESIQDRKSIAVTNSSTVTVN